MNSILFLSILRRCNIMATSTFGKQFCVKPEKANDFVKEMTKVATPTLQRNFRSNMVHLTREDSNLKESLLKALNS